LANVVRQRVFELGVKTRFENSGYGVKKPTRRDAATLRVDGKERGRCDITMLLKESVLGKGGR